MFGEDEILLVVAYNAIDAVADDPNPNYPQGHIAGNLRALAEYAMTRANQASIHLVRDTKENSP
jgi:hypothetical protein